MACNWGPLPSLSKGHQHPPPCLASSSSRVLFSPVYTVILGNILKIVIDADVLCLTWSQTWFCCCFKVCENVMDRIVKPCLSRASLTCLGPGFSLPFHTAAPWPSLALLCTCLLHFLQRWSSQSCFPGSLTPLIFHTASFEKCSLG